METIIENNSNNMHEYLTDYVSFLKNAKTERKRSITVTDLCDKLNVQKTTIYRIERAEVDPKLSTLMYYLHGFGYHLEIVSDKAEEPAPPDTTPDSVVNVGGKDVLIEQFDFNRAKTDKRFRIIAIKLLLEMFESDLDLNNGNTAEKESDDNQTERLKAYANKAQELKTKS